MTTNERLDRVEEAIKALTTMAMPSLYMEAEKRAATETVVRICAEFDARSFPSWCEAEEATTHAECTEKVAVPGSRASLPSQ
jgi:hypothetical protein